MARMGRYVVFCCDNYCAMGGMADAVGSANTLTAAKQMAESNKNDRIEIVDMVTGRTWSFGEGKWWGPVLCDFMRIAEEYKASRMAEHGT